jgi:hypothetical protein
MGFFDELPAPEPEPPQRHHPWEPPEADFPGIVAIDTLPLARSDRVAVAVTGMSAHANGFEIFLTARMRPDGQERPGPGGPGAARRSFRFGLQFADGSKAVSQHAARRGPDPVPATEPDGPTLSLFLAGGGPRTHFSRWWAWPLPPAGLVEFVCEWPVFGIPETRTAIDAGLILDAAGRSTPLWPEDEGGNGSGD